MQARLGGPGVPVELLEGDGIGAAVAAAALVSTGVGAVLAETTAVVDVDRTPEREAAGRVLARRAGPWRVGYWWRRIPRSPSTRIAPLSVLLCYANPIRSMLLLLLPSMLLLLSPAHISVFLLVSTLDNLTLISVHFHVVMNIIASI